MSDEPDFDTLFDRPAGAWDAPKVEAFKSAFYRFLSFVKVDSKETGGDTRLIDNIYAAQKRLLDAVFEGLSDDIHDFKCLKSRQLGISTICRPLILFWMGIHDGMQGALVFDTDAHKEGARRDITTMIEQLPKSLGFPTVVSDNRHGLTLSNRSVLQFLAAGTRSSRSAGALGRSSGLNLIWASEMCSWDNDEGIQSLRSSLAQEYPNRLYLWESTARGFGAWHDMWSKAQDDKLNQKTVFIGWWAKESQKIPAGTKAYAHYMRVPITPAEQLRIDEVAERYSYSVTPEQVAWYRRFMNPSGELAEGEEDFDGGEYSQQDQPWTEDEAWVMTGKSFFPMEALTAVMKETVSSKWKGYTYYPGQAFMDCQVSPARNLRMTQLRVWEEPDPDGVYVVGADPAFGHSEKNNNSAIQVLRCYADCIEQVAEYAYSEIRTEQFAWVIASLMGWYKNARLILEMNGPGDAVWTEYKNLRHLMTQGYMKAEAADRGLQSIWSNVKNYIYTRNDGFGVGGVFHWKTTTLLKVAIMERLRDFTCNGILIIRSKDVVDEMRNVTRDGEHIGTEGLRRDDRTFALALGIRAWEQTERRAMVTSNRTREIEIMRKRMTVRDQMSMMTSFQMDQFFKRKEKARTVARLTALNKSWKK